MTGSMPGMPRVHERHVGVGLGAEGGRGAREELGAARHLGVDLEPDDELPRPARALDHLRGRGRFDRSGPAWSRAPWQRCGHRGDGGDRTGDGGRGRSYGSDAEAGKPGGRRARHGEGAPVEVRGLRGGIGRARRGSAHRPHSRPPSTAAGVARAAPAEASWMESIEPPEAPRMLRPIAISLTFLRRRGLRRSASSDDRRGGGPRGHRARGRAGGRGRRQGGGGGRAPLGPARPLRARAAAPRPWSRRRRRSSPGRTGPRASAGRRPPSPRSRPTAPRSPPPSPTASRPGARPTPRRRSRTARRSGRG